MRFRAAMRSDVGQCRAANEDRCALEPDLGLFLVADGMGGHKAGQIAATLATRAVVEAMSGPAEAQPSLAEQLRAAVIHANSEIFHNAARHSELSGMGTTVVALLISGDRAALAHVGDSRAYRVRGGGIRQLTDDHSLVGELLRRHEISEDAAREHPHRHVLTRALGVRPGVQPDLSELTPAAGDVFVLCSDGLTHHVMDEEIAKHASTCADLDEAAVALIDLANGRGGEDNISVVLVRCEED